MGMTVVSSVKDLYDENGNLKPKGETIEFSTLADSIMGIIGRGRRFTIRGMKHTLMDLYGQASVKRHSGSITLFIRKLEAQKKIIVVGRDKENALYYQQTTQRGNQ